jgi:hypothetical protein
VLVASPSGSPPGGAGNDTFVFNVLPAAQSTIADLVHGKDVLQSRQRGDANVAQRCPRQRIGWAEPLPHL